MRWTLRWSGCGVEVGEGDAVRGEDGEFAVGEEVDVAGVVEDAGDVGGEEEFSVADADDGGRAHAGGDELVGLVGGEDADGEGSGEAVDGAADGFFEGDGGMASSRVRTASAVLASEFGARAGDWGLRLRSGRLWARCCPFAGWRG